MLEKRGFHKTRFIKFSDRRCLAAARSLSWFRDLLYAWTGTSVYQEAEFREAQDYLGFAADASHIGGAFVSPTIYSWYKWCPLCVEKNGGNTEVLELAAILIGVCSLFGSALSALMIIWLTDNSSAVTDFADGYAGNQLASDLIEEIRFELVRKQVNNFRLVHTPRRNLTEVDSITRGETSDILEFCMRHGNVGRSFLEAVTPRNMKRLSDGHFCFKLH
jgi:hypothetical protein